MNSYGVSDVFYDLVAEIVARERKLILDLLIDGAGDANAAWIRQALQPRRHVDAVANQIVPLDHHIADVDADAKMHPPVFRGVGFEQFDGMLDLSGAPDRLDRTREFGNHAVASRGEYPAIVLADEPIDQRAAVLKDTIGPFFVSTHHAREALTIGAEDGRKLAFRPVLFHRTLRNKRPASTQFKGRDRFGSIRQL